MPMPIRFTVVALLVVSCATVCPDAASTGNANRADSDVFETMLKFALKVDTNTPPAKVPTKHADLTLPGYPHKFDLFVPSSAPLYGIVFLHGGGGNKTGAEISLGLTVQWAEEHHVVVAVPQGQSVDTCGEHKFSLCMAVVSVVASVLCICEHCFFSYSRSPWPFFCCCNCCFFSFYVYIVRDGGLIYTAKKPCKAFTWSNYVMTSGQDDVAFLRVLAAYIHANHHPSKLYLSGHSNGGMMTNRMWCDTGSKIFDAFVAFDGPASELYNPDPPASGSSSRLNYLPCLVPSGDANRVPPFLSVVAFEDNVVGNTPEQNMAENIWTLPLKTYILAAYAYTHRGLLNDWFTYERLRAPLVCGQSPNRKQVYTRSNIDMWSACEGRVAVVAFRKPLANCSRLAAGHCIPYLQFGLGVGLLDFALEWARTDGASSKYLPKVGTGGGTGSGTGTGGVGTGSGMGAGWIILIVLVCLAIPATIVFAVVYKRRQRDRTGSDVEFINMDGSSGPTLMERTESMFSRKTASEGEEPLNYIAPDAE